MKKNEHKYRNSATTPRPLTRRELRLLVGGIDDCKGTCRDRVQEGQCRARCGEAEEEVGDSFGCDRGCSCCMPKKD